MNYNVYNLKLPQSAGKDTTLASTPTRETRRTELHKAIWDIADEVRGTENKYDLSVSAWVEKEDTREKIDIAELNERIARIVARESELRSQIDVIVADLENEEN